MYVVGKLSPKDGRFALPAKVKTMKIKKVYKRICWVFAALLLSVLCIFESVHTRTVKADSTETVHATVMDDLKRDPNFDESKYPDKAKDYSLQVINIAESESDNLYIYVYQPSHNTLDLVGSKISMYFGKSVNGKDFTPDLYDIELVSTQGVFDKYLVKGVTVSDEAYRYYNIVSIFRRVNAEAGDREIQIGTKEEVAFNVGQQWCAYYYNDLLIYEMNTFKTMKLDVTANGYLYFLSGVQWGNLVGLKTNCDAHFIAFNAPDYQIEHIFDADLTYQVRTKDKTIGIGSDGEWRYGEYESVDVTLKDTDVAVYNDRGIFESTYTWNRICSSSDFVKQFEEQDGELYETDKETILSSQWVFAFCETSHNTTSGVGYTNFHQYDVDDVAILRIHFQDTSGEFYNLGVVAAITSSADEPSGTAGGIDIDLDWLADLFVWVFFGLFLILICTIFTPVMNLFVWLFKGLWWLVCLPFKLLELLFKGIGKLFKRKNKH